MITHLDQLASEASWLESTRRFDRWAIGPEDSVWVCADCGAVVEDLEAGCRACGADDEEEGWE